MAVMNLTRAEEGEAGQTLVEAAAALLAARRSDVSRDFLLALFERATPDDLMRYSPDELAGIGEQSWSFICYTVNFTLGVVSNLQLIDGMQANTRV